MLKFISLFALSLLVLLFAACGGSEDSESGRLRVIHAAPGTGPLQLLLDNDIAVERLTYGSESGYFDVDSDLRRIRVRVPGVVTAVIDENRTFAPDADYTLVVTGPTDQVRMVFKQDQEADPEQGEFKLRIANFSQEARNIRTFITLPNAEIDSDSPAISSTSLYSFSRYLDIPQGTYRIRFTERRGDEVIFDSGILKFQEADIRTLMLLDSPEGDGTFISLLLSDTE